MKHTHQFARRVGTVVMTSPSGERAVLPVIPGILKHPSCERLPELLEKPNVARKYTVLALQKASWPILRQFPEDWLRECIDEARLPASRKKALLFLLG